MKEYTKNGVTVNYIIIYKPIKHIYFRIKENHILITANKKLKEKEILTAFDKHFESLISKANKNKRIKIPNFYIWGKEIESINDEKNYRQLLIDETVNQIKKFEEKLTLDLEKINLKVVNTKVKLLKSKFGSCHTVKKEITINAFLAKLDPIYLYYVLLHEYAHFIVPNHSKAFYDVLDILMPNHKIIQKNLRKHQISF